MGALRRALAADGGRLVAGGGARGFPIERRRATPGELVDAPVPGSRRAVLAEPTSGAVVLGSTQDAALLDPRAVATRGLAVVRRRSGGGAVLVAPGAQVWLDLFVPAEDPLFRVDVSHAAHLAGEVWRDALVEVGVEPGSIEVHRGGMVASRWSRAWCFAGLGPGEVCVGGRKLVGVSQRRSRAGAWLFTMALCALDPLADASLLALSPAEQRDLADELARSLTVLPAAAAEVEASLIRRLGRT